MSYTDSSLRFWLSPTQLKCGNTPSKASQYWKKTRVCSRVCFCSGLGVKACRKGDKEALVPDEWKSKRKKKHDQCQCHPPPPPVRLTNFQAVAGHRRAEGLGSRGYSKVSCTAWQIMAGSSMTRCAHHPGNTGCSGDETTSFINHTRLTRCGW